MVGKRLNLLTCPFHCRLRLGCVTEGVRDQRTFLLSKAKKDFRKSQIQSICFLTSFQLQPFSAVNDPWDRAEPRLSLG